MYPVQRKLFSTLFWEKEPGKEGVFHAVQIMKNISGKNLFRRATELIMLHTSSYTNRPPSRKAYATRALSLSGPLITQLFP